MKKQLALVLLTQFFLANTSLADYRFDLTGDIIRQPHGPARATLRITPERGGPTLQETLDLQEVRLVGFEKALLPTLGDLNPLGALPRNLGTAKKQVQCKFTYRDHVYTPTITLPTAYPLLGEWQYQEDGEHRAINATLNLRVNIDGQINRIVHQHRTNVPYTFVRAEPEADGDYYFDGRSVHRQRMVRQLWQNPRDRREHWVNIVRPDGEIASHRGSRVIYSEPFSVTDDPTRATDDYVGKYTFGRELVDRKKLTTDEVGQLIYSDGRNYFLPQVTQELWRQGDSQVGFLLASYKDDRRLNFVADARITGRDRLPEGLYQLKLVDDSAARRKETWRKLGGEPVEYEITTPKGVASIPGLGSSVPRHIQNVHGAEQVAQLQHDITEVTRRTQESMAAHAGEVPPRSVIILGPSRIGKSTLINHLAGAALTVDRGARGFRINVANSRFNIGHRHISETSIPGGWYDEENNVVYWDCQGLGDTGGAVQDIVNAYSFSQLFKNPAGVKVLLTVSEPYLDNFPEFAKILNQLTGLIEDDHELQQSIALITTKHTGYDVPAVLTEMIRDVEAAGDRAALLTDRSKNLLRFLAREAASRTATFPVPTREGAYNPDKRPIVHAIEAAHYVESPAHTTKVAPESELLVLDLARNINDHITTYMKTEGARQIVSYCRRQIDGFVGAIGDLRQTFTNVVRDLRALARVSAELPERFAERLRAFFNSDAIARNISLLKFLKGIKADVTFNIAEWSNALLDTIQQIQNLAAAPETRLDRGVLRISGTLVGTSEVNAAVRAAAGAISNVNVFGLNSLIVDEDVTHQGVSYTMAAPRWKVRGNRTINLSGRAGASRGTAGTDTDGAPGNPGGNSGHFYGKGFKFEGIQNLTVNTNGGAGGQGQNGGTGANGGNGADGALGTETSRQGWGRSYVGPNDEKRRNEPHIWNWLGDGIAQHEVSLGGTIVYYHSRGSDGSAGHNGGRGGQGGLGGHRGESVIDGYAWRSNPQDGADGANGAAGAGGRGGTHGRHCTGSLLTGVRARYEIWRSCGLFGMGREIERRDDAISDRWETSLAYEGSRGRAADGSQPSGINSTGRQAAAAQTVLDLDAKRRAFKDFYLEQSGSAVVSPFVESCPDL